MLQVRGSKVTSRLWNYCPERLSAAGFLALQYMEPNSSMDVDTFNTMTKKLFGYEVGGYWLFYSAEDAAELMEKNVCIALWNPIDVLACTNRYPRLVFVRIVGDIPL
jgi:hypothetical protein